MRPCVGVPATLCCGHEQSNDASRVDVTMRSHSATGLQQPGGPPRYSLGDFAERLGSVWTVAPRGTSRRIADELRTRIRAHELSPGTSLPSEAVLAESYDVARGTVRAALAALADEGLIEVVPGIGRRVVGAQGADRTTAYRRIAEDLAEQIRAGTLAPNATLPSEASVMEHYHVSRNTARRAFKVLADSGVVVVRHGVGAFVRSAES